MGDICYEVNGRPTARDVCDLTLAIGWRDPARHGLDLVQRVWDQAPCTVLARNNGRLVGMCRAYWDGGLMATITNVAVRPEYQHQGIGTQLVTMLVEELRKADVKRITLHSASPGFYERLGFEMRPHGVAMMLQSEESH